MNRQDAIITVPLAHPVGHEGATYHKLTLRRATTGDLIAFEEDEGGNLRKSVAMLARLTGVPFEVAAMIDAADSAALSGHIGKMRGDIDQGKSPEAGSRPSP